MSDRVNHWEPEDPPVVDSVRDEDIMVPGQPSVQHRGDSVTAGTLPDEDEARLHHWRSVRTPLARWLGIFGVACVLTGAVAGLVWELAVPLTTYQITADGYAPPTERGLAGYIAGDAWFVLIGLILGVACGVVCWAWFGGLGWPVVPLAVGSALLMSVVCWQVGWLLGPGPLERRIADAKPGDVVPIELTITAPATLLVWPFSAVLVLMLASALMHDPEDGR